jgi:hypothetical protein
VKRAEQGDRKKKEPPLEVVWFPPPCRFGNRPVKSASGERPTFSHSLTASKIHLSSNEDHQCMLSLVLLRNSSFGLWVRSALRESLLPVAAAQSLFPTLTPFSLNDHDCCCRSISLKRSEFPCKITFIPSELDPIPKSVATSQNHIRSADTNSQGLEIVTRPFCGTYLVRFWSGRYTSLRCVVWEGETKNWEGGCGSPLSPLPYAH